MCSDQKINHGLDRVHFIVLIGVCAPSARCGSRPASCPFTPCDFCIQFGCVSIECKIKRLIIKHTVYKHIKRLSACTFISRSEANRMFRTFARTMLEGNLRSSSIYVV